MENVTAMDVFSRPFHVYGGVFGTFRTKLTVQICKFTHQKIKLPVKPKLQDQGGLNNKYYFSKVPCTTTRPHLPPKDSRKQHIYSGCSVSFLPKLPLLAAIGSSKHHPLLWLWTHWSPPISPTTRTKRQRSADRFNRFIATPWRGSAPTVATTATTQELAAPRESREKLCSAKEAAAAAAAVG